MKFKCEADKLSEALSSAQRIVGSRSSSLPGLSGLRLNVVDEYLEILATDLQISISRELHIGNAAPGVAVVPGKLLSDIVRSLQGAVTIEKTNDKMLVEAGRSQFAVSLMPSEDFPKMPELDGKKGSVDGKLLLDALHQVNRAASNDDARPILTGVLFVGEPNSLRLVATDSYRLAIRNMPGQSLLDDGQTVLIPARALRELERLCAAAPSVEVTIGDKRVGFQIEGTTLITSLIDGDFPNYRQLIPQNYPNRVEIDKEQLIDAIRRVQLLVKDALTPVRVAIKAESVTLTVSQESGQATEELECNYNGEEMTVAFNPNYFREGVEATPGDRVVIETVDPMKLATLKGTADDEFLYLLMPVRVA